MTLEPRKPLWEGATEKVQPKPAPVANAQAQPVPPAGSVAIQTGSEPTRKVAAATNYGSTAGALIAGAMTLYGDGAIRELLATVGGCARAVGPAVAECVPLIGPKMTDLIVFMAVGAAVLVGGRLTGRAAAYNVLDAPNVAMAPVASPTVEDVR